MALLKGNRKQDSLFSELEDSYQVIITSFLQLKTYIDRSLGQFNDIINRLEQVKKNESTTADTSTPGLSKLPIIGGLFSSTKTAEATQEVAIFITAHLICDSVALVQPAKRVKKVSSSGQPAEEDLGG